MALLVLFILGATLGWFATIVVRMEDAPGVLRNIALGTICALVSGILINNGGILGALSWTSLGAAAFTSVVILAAYNYWLQKRAGPLVD